MSDFAEKTKSLSDTELRVLGILHMLGGSWIGYGDCYWTHSAILGGEGNITDITEEVGGKPGLSKVLKKLRSLGLVNFAKGLMDDDGNVCGAGNAPDAMYEEDLEVLCEERGWL